MKGANFMNINNFNLGSNFRAQQMQQDKLELNPENLVKVEKEEVEVQEEPVQNSTVLTERTKLGKMWAKLCGKKEDAIVFRSKEIDDGRNVQLYEYRNGSSLEIDYDNGKITRTDSEGNSTPW